MKLSGIGKLLKRHFLAGLFVVIPIGVIGWIIGAAVGLLWKLPYLLPDNLQPDNIFFDHATIAAFFNLILTIVATLVVTFGISFVGWRAPKDNFCTPLCPCRAPKKGRGTRSI